MSKEVKRSPYINLAYALNSDRKQVRFYENGWMHKPEPPKIETTSAINPTEEVMCPFCLYQAKLREFFISTNKGISTDRAQCPDCKNGMKIRTLIVEMDAEQYAGWVYNYRSFGFWKKCPFDKWKLRLKNIGWALQFWGKYKALKQADSVDGTLTVTEEQAKQYEDAYADYEASFK